jgi:hypothetical protein
MALTIIQVTVVMLLCVAVLAIILPIVLGGLFIGIVILFIVWVIKKRYVY